MKYLKPFKFQTRYLVVTNWYHIFLQINSMNANESRKQSISSECDTEIVRLRTEISRHQRDKQATASTVEKLQTDLEAKVS